MTDDEAEIRDSRIFGIGAKTTCSEWAYFPVQNIVSWLLILVVILYHICTTNTLNKRVNINILESYPKVDKFCIGNKKYRIGNIRTTSKERPRLWQRLRQIYEPMGTDSPRYPTWRQTLKT